MTNSEKQAAIADVENQIQGVKDRIDDLVRNRVQVIHFDGEKSYQMQARLLVKELKVLKKEVGQLKRIRTLD